MVVFLLEFRSKAAATEPCMTVSSWSFDNVSCWLDSHRSWSVQWTILFSHTRHSGWLSVVPPLPFTYVAPVRIPNQILSVQSLLVIIIPLTPKTETCILL